MKKYGCLLVAAFSVLLLSGMLLTGCQRVPNTEATDTPEASVTAPDVELPTDAEGNILEGSTLPDVSGDVERGNTRKAEATATTTEAPGHIALTANGKRFSVTLENNRTAESFKNQLPLTLAMTELNGNEKYYYYSALPSDPDPSIQTIHAGDIMLYEDNTIVVFYHTFQTSYSYTPIGHVDNTKGFAKALGQGDVEVAFTLS